MRIRRTKPGFAIFEMTRRRVIRGGTAVVTTIALCVIQAVAHGQVIDWNNPSGIPDPFYHNGVNWVGFSAPNSNQTAHFNLPFSYEVWWNGVTEAFRPQVRTLDVDSGNITFLNQDNSVQRELYINGLSSYSNLSISGPSTRLTTRGVHLRTQRGAEITSGAWFTVDGSHSAGTQLSIEGTGLDVSGMFRVISGGKASNQGLALIGRLSGTSGTATVSGAGSEWTVDGNLYVGNAGSGVLNINSGGLVSSRIAYIGSSSNGDANVNGGSQWNNSSSVYVGVAGTGTLDVKTGSVVTGRDGYIGWQSGSNGTVTIVDAGSQWDSNRNLYVGGSSTGSGGNGTLNINTDGLVTVANTTRIWQTGTVNLNGGRFEFGQMSYDDFDSINANSGSLAGTVNHSAFSNVADMTGLQNSAVDLSGVSVANTGTMHGNASLKVSVSNQASGEMTTNAGDMMRLTGAGNINAGEINNFGGTVRFEQELTNQNGGFITGRGQFMAHGGWTNEGVMAFTAGPADVLGDLVNQSGGQVVTSGGATTTFFDDVVHNGTEIRTSAASNTVFFGDVSGAGPFTGTGTVYFEGDLRPGNSPDVVDFEGNVVLGSNASSFFELGGLNQGEFDRLNIAGDLSLDGDLSVSLLNGFELAYNQEFLVASVDGQLQGQFDSLADGALIGNYGGIDLFLTYGGGDGNDVTMFTTVPEPASGMLGIAGMVGCCLVRRRRTA